ncbi:hypothetical protein ACEZCY_09235 [Streptacidiphilus sp. N1-12]|uniref:Uncharacterized protein n=2 Tax=Streptacidiphilus alkalitolerans TaxID=3342712 RepID=A0ABV6WBS8_9ACTN
MADAFTDISENRLNAAPGHHNNNEDTAGKHRGTVAEDDREGRREPAGHGRHRRVAAAND